MYVFIMFSARDRQDHTPWIVLLSLSIISRVHPAYISSIISLLLGKHSLSSSLAALWFITLQFYYTYSGTTD